MCPQFTVKRAKYFTVSSLKVLFYHLNAHVIVDFIKDIGFYNHLWYYTSPSFTLVLSTNSCFINLKKKTSQFKTQCKGDISHAFETAKITLFDPTICKTSDAPLENELLCWTFVHWILLLTFILCKFLYHYIWLMIVDYSTVGLMFVAHLKWGKGNDL